MAALNTLWQNSIFTKRQVHRACFALLLASLLCFTGCTRSAPECEGPALDIDNLIATRRSLFSTGGPGAQLVLPNPVDAAAERNLRSNDLNSLADALSLQNLMTPGRLDSDFIRVRINSINDNLSRLATPNSDGNYVFDLNDVHYSETMGYFATQSIMSYVEALGFPTVKTRPLFVLVRSQEEGQDPNEINAFYEHNYLNPDAPRIMRLIGNTNFATGVDRNMYWHEFGHLHNESITFERGFDYAGDNGAIYTEGSSLHECLADYLAESVAGTGYIGRWIAYNFSEIPSGEPLRYAVDPNGVKQQFSEVISADGTGFVPERYGVAEWCTRVLWEIRSQWVNEDPEAGAILADRLIFSAMGLLGRDASMGDFANAVVEADEELHCGLHEKSIKSAFTSRGFDFEPQEAKKQVTLVAEPLGLANINNQLQIVPLAPGIEFTFDLTLNNPNSTVARNVRVILDSPSAAIFPTTYMQAFGDLAPGQTIVVGGDGIAGLPSDHSLFGEIDQRAARGSNIPYRLRVLVENGPTTVVEGELRL